MEEYIKKRLNQLKDRYKNELQEYEKLKNKINSKEKIIISIKGAINEFEDVLNSNKESGG